MENNIAPQGKKGRVALALVGMILLAGIVTVSILRDRIVNQNVWTINVVGQGKMSYQPDIANITLGVQIDKAESAAVALDQLDVKITKIFEALKNAGVPEKNIQTQNYSLTPFYDFVENASQLTGYNANQLLTVKVENIQVNSEMVSQIISVASKAGANQVNGVSFELSNMNEIKQETRIKAIADARSKANSLAGALGVELGKLVGWWENPVSEQYYYYDGKGGFGGGESGGPTVPAGDREYVVEVNLNYKIK